VTSEKEAGMNRWRKGAFAVLLLCGVVSSVFGIDEKKLQAGSGFVGGWLTGKVSYDFKTLDSGTSTDHIRTLRAGLDAFVGYFVANGFELGPVVSVTYNHENNRTSGVDSWSGKYGLGVQTGYYINTKTIVVPHVRLIAQAVLNDMHDDQLPSDTRLWGGSGRLGPGVSLFFTEHMALDMDLYYAVTWLTGSYEEGGLPSVDVTELSQGGTFMVGISLFL